jgi:hypothetical protein
MTLYYKEESIIGDPKDFINVKHLILKGTPYDIEYKLSELARIRHKIEPKKSIDPLITKAQKRYFERNYPLHIDRLKATAEAYNINYDNNNYDFSYLGPASTPLLCSGAFYPGNTTETGDSILIHNEDFNTGSIKELTDRYLNYIDTQALAKPYIIQLYPDKGYPMMFQLCFEFFGEPLGGINSEGLSIVHLADIESYFKYNMEPTVYSQPGLNELLLPRFILDNCADVEEARELLLINKHYYMIMPCHYLITDRHGDSIIWEISARGNREFILDGNKKPQIITNFPVYKYKSIEELPRNLETACEYTRYRRLHQLITNHTAKYSLEFIKEAHQKISFNYCNFEGMPSAPLRTIWTSIYNNNKRSLDISFYLREEDSRSTEGGGNAVTSEFFNFTL